MKEDHLIPQIKMNLYGIDYILNSLKLRTITNMNMKRLLMSSRSAPSVLRSIEGLYIPQDREREVPAKST
jgi:hypothetical protein